MGAGGSGPQEEMEGHTVGTGLNHRQAEEAGGCPCEGRGWVRRPRREPAARTQALQGTHAADAQRAGRPSSDPVPLTVP